MKLFLMILSVVALSAAETYSTENDDLDIDALVGSVDNLKSYYGCFAGISTCDTVQSSFKKDLPEAVQQACAKCTPAQKHILKRFLAALKEKTPETYKDFKKTFDPENKYFDALEAAVANS